ncbi:ATPase V [Pseudoflavonifractor capillosus]|uniref:V-type ATP synthase subunit I n=1 Tax=Pseudoflavonifractor capillosus TaxID=106588 RepID=UPI00195C6BD3|nr:V-type ATPase 116kDa subunit family protein [Pseudoflavonifractor capillosus]MBM6896783.1 ATPase V [Pseudoflavonifractor capillosus]
MSVQAMKFVTVTGPRKEFDQVVRRCIVDQPFHPESVLQVMHRNTRLRALNLSNPIMPLLRQAEEVLTRLELQPEYRPFSEGAELEEGQKYLDDLTEKLDQMDQWEEALKQEAADDRSSVSQLEKLSSLSVQLDTLRNMDHLVFRFGHLPEDSYRTFSEVLDKREDCFFFPTHTENSQVYGCYFALKSREEKVDALFASMHFVPVPLNDRLGGTAQEAIAALRHEMEDDEQALEQLKTQRAELAGQQQEHLLSLRSWLCRENQVMEMRRFGARSKETFYLMGWVPEEDLQDFLARLDSYGKLDYVVDKAEETELTPPTKLKNSLLGRIFEPFLRMYGLPNYHEYDPSLFMAITYCIFFGIMFGDVGQGLGLALIGLFLATKKKMWLGKIIVCCGLSSTVFGFVYGSVFGFEEILPGFKILEGSNVVYLLVASLAMGVVMLAFVMVLNVLNGIRQHDFDKIFFGPNGLAGMVFYLGLIIGAVVTLLTGYNMFRLWYVLIVLVLPLILILFREPLSALAEGKEDWKPESLGGLLVSGFFELFETLLSFLTNTLSFLRVGAYAITHVCLMLVIHTMAGANLNPIVLILGNLFVMGFEGLLVGIQVLRLEFYELFGRFYQDSGREYCPRLVDYTTKNS